MRQLGIINNGSKLDLCTFCNFIGLHMVKKSCTYNGIGISLSMNNF